MTAPNSAIKGPASTLEQFNDWSKFKLKKNSCKCGGQKVPKENQQTDKKKDEGKTKTADDSEVDDAGMIAD